MENRIGRLGVNEINAAMGENRRGLLQSSSPMAADAAIGSFVVAHDLGFAPDPLEWMVQYSAEDAVTVRATKDNKRAWAKSTIQVTGSAAGRVYVWLVRRT